MLVFKGIQNYYVYIRKSKCIFYKKNVFNLQDMQFSYRIYPLHIGSCPLKNNILSGSVKEYRLINSSEVPKSNQKCLSLFITYFVYSIIRETSSLKTLHSVKILTFKKEFKTNWHVFLLFSHNLLGLLLRIEHFILKL